MVHWLLKSGRMGKVHSYDERAYREGDCPYTDCGRAIPPGALPVSAKQYRACAVCLKEYYRQWGITPEDE